MTALQNIKIKEKMEYSTVKLRIFNGNRMNITNIKNKYKNKNKKRFIHNHRKQKIAKQKMIKIGI